MYLVEEKRLNKMKEVLSRRQNTLRVFMDYVHNPHNFSAIIRTCDAVGVPAVYYRYEEKEIPLNKDITLGSHRWISVERVNNAKQFIQNMKKEGFQVVGAVIDSKAVDFREIDYTIPTLIVIGNEVNGVTKEVKTHLDRMILIPMYGMAQSLNVSVANGVILYEAQRQRVKAGMYDKPSLKSEEIKKTLKKWAYDDIIRR